MIFLLSLIWCTTSGYGQAEPATYRNVIGRFVKYYNANQADSIFNMFAPEVKVSLPLDKNRQMVGELQTRLGALGQATYLNMAENVAAYKVDFQRSTLLMKISLAPNNHISGLLFDNYTPGKPATPAAADAKPTIATNANNTDPEVTETPFALKTLAGTINGTIALPKQFSGKIPVVLIVAAGGLTDRDGNKSAQNQRPDSYKLLATALAKNGIASLRYDKRLVGEQVTVAKEKLLRFNDYVDDAVAIITQIHDDPRFSKVVVLGHSEGSLAGMLAAYDQPVSGFISVEGESQPGDKIVTEQMKLRPEFLRENFKSILDTMRRGKVNEKVDPSNYDVARVSIQPFQMSWMAQEPAKAIKKLKIPVLIVQGTTDLQVAVADAERLKKAKSDAKLVTITGMKLRTERSACHTGG